MRTVNFRDDTLYGVAALLGIDPTVDLLTDQAVQWARFANSNVRYAWEFWDWPELTITEERAFRTVWDASLSYSTGEDVYYIPTKSYYTAIVNTSSGDLPTDNTKFSPIASGALDTYIARFQRGKQNIGRVIAVYDRNPRLNAIALGWRYRPGPNGIDVPLTSGPTVWITFLPEPSRFTATPYAAGTYNYEDVVYDPTSGNCYLSLVDNNTDALTVASSWLLQPMPYTISEYVKYATASDAADDMQTSAQFRAMADEKLHRQIDMLIEEGEVHFYPRRRKRRGDLLLQGIAGYQLVPGAV